MSEELTAKDPVPVDKEDVDKKKEEVDKREEEKTENKDDSGADADDADSKKDKDDQNKVDRVEELEAQQEADAKKDSKKDSNDSEVPPTPPPKPPRPLSPFAQAEAQLKEAFPDTEASVIKAVLVASGGQLDPAFTALLSMSDPNFKPEIAPPQAGAGAGGVSQQQQQSRSQIEEDERLARQLAEEYNRGNSAGSQYPPPPGARSGSYSSSRVRRSGGGYSGRYDEPRPQNPERSFLDDDLPEIRENLQKGFNETREKVTSWMTNIRKRLDGDGDEFGGGAAASSSGQPQQNRLFGALGRNSGEYEGSQSPQQQQRQGYGYDRRRDQSRRYYDRDPKEINDDFQGISLRDDDFSDDDVNEAKRPAKPPRPGQVSAFGDQPTSAKNGGNSGNSKWEPLKSSSNNDADADKDPFFIGESDDEDEPKEDAKKATGTK